MKIGCHVGNSGPLMLEGSIKEALSYGATCFMVYLGPPQNTIRKPIESMNADKMALIAKENNICLDDVIIHAPYIVNLANKNDLNKWDGAVSIIEREVVRCEAFGSTILVLHPGAHMNYIVEQALKHIAEAIDIIYDRHPESKVKIALETTIKGGFGNNPSFCHGDLGNLSIVKYAAKILKDKKLENRCENTFNSIFNNVIKERWNKGVFSGTESMGLMVGLSSFGYALLRESENDIPDI